MRPVPPVFNQDPGEGDPDERERWYLLAEDVLRADLESAARGEDIDGIMMRTWLSAVQMHEGQTAGDDDAAMVWSMDPEDPEWGEEDDDD